jgi:hypothetical protein
MRTMRLTMFALCLAAIPSPAFADAGSFPSTTSDYIVLGTGVLTLVAAMSLMVIALLLEHASSGSVVAENISWVVAACLCLGASVLAKWTSLFLEPGSLGASQAVLGADLLTLTGLVLLCLYFWRVRAALLRFTRILSGKAKAERPGADGGGESGPDA